MSTDDKVRNAAEKAKGAVKETTGKVTGDRSLEAEGRIDQSKADLKQAGEKVKDSLRD
ncbi:MAG: CsbD family protein [Actinomycetales bacterium]|nr:CsbD family protein [Actinomycetales bacterium]